MLGKEELRTFHRAVPLLHAAFFAIGGGWANLGRRSFEAISGPKVDYWLVRTVGGLLVVVGTILANASRRERVTPEIGWLAVGSSSVLIAIDVVYTAKDRIRRVYLLDAAVNIVLIMGWIDRRFWRTPASRVGVADSEPRR